MFEDITKYNMETESPIYNQIVQIENIMMHELKMIIEQKGGRHVVSVNTDCCYCEFPNGEFPLKLLLIMSILMVFILMMIIKYINTN
jgi:hypothetical protein